jgi:hypothetical protein
LPASRQSEQAADFFPHVSQVPSGEIGSNTTDGLSSRPVLQFSGRRQSGLSLHGFFKMEAFGLDAFRCHYSPEASPTLVARWLFTDTPERQRQRTVWVALLRFIIRSTIMPAMPGHQVDDRPADHEPAKEAAPP